MNPSAGPSSNGFIFSYNSTDKDIQTLSRFVDPSTFDIATTSTSTRQLLYEDDEFVPYGPTTYRKGKVRFVSGGYLGGEQVMIKREDKGKGRAIDRDRVKEEESSEIRRKEYATGNAVRGLYSEIVGIRQTTSTKPERSPPPPPTQKKRRISRSSPSLPSLTTSSASSSREADIVLSSDSEPEPLSPSSSSSINNDSSDDLIIIDPLTNLPERPPPPRVVVLKKRPRLEPRKIHELLGETTDPILVPPTYYALRETNVGYRLLSKQGWKEGETLGPIQLADQTREDGGGRGRGLKVPLRAIEKFDRKGLGSAQGGKGKGKDRWEMSGKEKERERAKLREEEIEKRGKGEKGMERQLERENRERKAWIAYMNS